EALSAAAGTPPRPYGAHPFYRFCLAAGEALVGGAGPPGVAGDVGARAGMLAGAARPGEVLLSQQNPHPAAGAIDTESAGPDRFLLRSAHAGLRPLAVSLDAPLVGRDEEMRRLQGAYARATRERVTMTVTVIGEAGLGKTRLVQEFAGGVGRKAHFLTGRCPHYGEGNTFYPPQEAGRHARDGDPPGTTKDLLDREPGA